MSKLTILPHPSVQEIERGLREWEKRAPDRVQVMEIGRTVQGLPLLCARITDAAVSDGDKQVVLFTATHAGPELNSCTGLLRTAKWLAGDEGTAPEIRRHVVTLICPCMNPEGYENLDVKRPDPEAIWNNSVGGNPYAKFYTWDGVIEPEKNPEVAALVRLVDDYLPDVHADIHGTPYERGAMWETTGWSWGSSLARPYCRRLVDEMNHAADEAGFFSVFPEESSGRLRTTHRVEGAQSHFYYANPAINDVVMSTHRSHAISFCTEAGYDEATVIRLRRCLELGMEIWRGEFYKGYPTLQVGGWTSMTVAAWGETAAQRRRSRVELWRRTDSLDFGCGWPEPACARMMAFCATTPDAIQRFLTPDGVRTAMGGDYVTIAAVLDRIRTVQRFDVDAIAEFVRPSTMLHACTLRPVEPGRAAGPPRHGLALRLHIPYADAEIEEVRLDGHLIKPSAREGYQMWGNPGTTVQVNIPPGKVADFHIVTCRYRTEANRRNGFVPEDWDLGPCGR